MTVKTQDSTLKLSQNLDARNKEVEKAFHLVTQSLRTLLTPFESRKYRTYILVDHTKSGKETMLIQEFICFFFSITLSVNKAGYRMLYFRYDEESLTRFGARLYNRALRLVFKHTMFESTKLNIEDSVRVNAPANVQAFFIHRLAEGENTFVSIDIEESLLS